MKNKTKTLVKCVRCGTPIESCAFCDEPDCRTPTCYECVSTVLVQAKRQPHTHGG